MGCRRERLTLGGEIRDSKKSGFVNDHHGRGWSIKEGQSCIGAGFADACMVGGVALIVEIDGFLIGTGADNQSRACIVGRQVRHEPKRDHGLHQKCEKNQ